MKWLFGISVIIVCVAVAVLFSRFEGIEVLTWGGFNR